MNQNKVKRQGLRGLNGLWGYISAQASSTMQISDVCVCVQLVISSLVYPSVSGHDLDTSLGVP